MTRALGLVEVGLGLVMQVVAHAGLAEGHLVGHAEGVDHLVVLVAVQNACDWLLLDDLLRVVGRLSEVVLGHLLRVVQVWHVLLRVVQAWRLPLACPIADLAISCCLIHVVTHLIVVIGVEGVIMC
jgi:hypothetical protein